MSSKTTAIFGCCIVVVSSLLSSCAVVPLVPVAASAVGRIMEANAKKTSSNQVPQAAETSSPEIVTQELELVTVKSSVSAANIRSAPSKTAAVVGKVSGGMSLEKLTENTAWVNVRADGADGWISKTLLEL